MWLFILPVLLIVIAIPWLRSNDQMASLLKRKNVFEKKAEPKKEPIIEIAPEESSDTVNGYELSEYGKQMDFRKAKPGSYVAYFAKDEKGHWIAFDKYGAIVTTRKRPSNPDCWTTMKELRKYFKTPDENHPLYWDWLAEESSLQVQEAECIHQFIKRKTDGQVEWP